MNTLNRKKLVLWAVVLGGIVAILALIGSSVDNPFGSGNLDERQQTLYAVIDDVQAHTATAGAILRVTAEFDQTATVQARTLRCADFPQYCVPLVGGETLAGSESGETRALDEPSHGAAGVVRGFTDDQTPFIGSVDAPVQLALVTDLACVTCRTYQDEVFQQVLTDFVLTGQAAVRLVLISETGGAPAEQAAQAALCAGEQGGLWEMADALFRAPSMTFALADLETAANDVGLDGGTVAACVESGRYAALLPGYAAFAQAEGVPGPPTMLVLDTAANEWTIIRRDYNSLREAVEARTDS